MGYEGKTAIVTGANRGIGLAIAKKLAAEGFNVAACVRSHSEVLSELIGSQEYESQEHRVFDLDLTDKNSMDACAKGVVRWASSIDVLVNNAGVAHGSAFAMTRMVDLREVFEINFFSQIYFSQLLVKRMIRARSGSIVNIASTSGILADVGTLAYGCSKASLIHATKIMAAELGTFGIRVNCIAPSLTETDMMELVDEKTTEALDQRTALPGRIGPEEVANLVAYLVSDQTNSLTGQCVRIDKGMPM